MSDSDKTTEVDNKVILEAILELTKKVDRLEDRFNDYEKFSNAQFEAIRQGISANSAAFDRLEAKFHDNRSEFLNFRADIKDMHEEIRRWKKETTKETMELS